MTMTLDPNNNTKNIYLHHENLTSSNTFAFFKKSSSFSDSPAPNTYDSSPENSKKEIRVLIADDIKVNRKLLSRVFCNLRLKRNGQTYQFKIEEAENGQNAVDKTIQAKEEPYSLIFMDIEMPVKDGYQATKEILAKDQNAIIVAYTNVPKEECLKKEPGFKSYVAKGELGKVDFGRMLKELISASHKREVELCKEDEEEHLYNWKSACSIG